MTEVVAACCGDHLASGCCGDACEACCGNCPTCPALAIERHGKAAVADVAESELRTWAAVEVVTVFEPDALAAAASAVAELTSPFPHMEGSVA